jgi:hypothetical protein
MKSALILTAALALTACGGGSDDKELFSLWTRNGDNATFDLRGMRFGSGNYIELFGQDGTRCLCNVAVIGTQESGSMAVTGCISAPYNPARQPTCEAANVAGNYSKAPEALTLTVPSGVTTYR